MAYHCKNLFLNKFLFLFSLDFIICFNIFINNFLSFNLFFDINCLILFWIIWILLSYLSFPSFHFSKANLNKSLLLFLSLLVNIFFNLLVFSFFVFIYLFTWPTSLWSVTVLIIVFLYRFMIKSVNFFWSSNFFFCIFNNICLQKFWIILALSLSVYIVDILFQKWRGNFNLCLSSFIKLLIILFNNSLLLFLFLSFSISYFFLSHFVIIFIFFNLWSFTIFFHLFKYFCK